MEKLYLIEVFLDRIAAFPTPLNDILKKVLTVKVRFGPSIEFNLREQQVVLNRTKIEDITETDDRERKKVTRVIRSGTSLLLPSTPEDLLVNFEKNPLLIEIWDDDKSTEEYVGYAKLLWHQTFLDMIKATINQRNVPPATAKQVVPFLYECICNECAYLYFIIRLTCLDKLIFSEFQQLLSEPDIFVYQQNKVPSIYQTKRIEGDDPGFVITGAPHESDVKIVECDTRFDIEICNPIKSCDTSKRGIKTYPIDKIKMGDITGPCGNKLCPLVRKVKTYIRNLDSYKDAAGALATTSKPAPDHPNACGKCICKNDRWHQEECPTDIKKRKCVNCGGLTCVPCDYKQKRLYTDPKLQINFVLSAPQMKNISDRDIIIQDWTCVKECYSDGRLYVNSDLNSSDSFEKRTSQSQFSFSDSELQKTSLSLHSKNPNVFNVESRLTKPLQIYNVTFDEECHCEPPKLPPPCNAFNCECVQNALDHISRKRHKPYCPQYKHLKDCPVKLREAEEEEGAEKDEYEDEPEPLPYGLPPVTLGPCPVMGRPCIVPDGFQRMHRTAVMEKLPASYSKAGKVCCTEEFERIKKAIAEYTRKDKPQHDLRCINTFNVDTERRCCDDEQELIPLTGVSCCGKHKLRLQEKYINKKLY